MKRSPMNPGTKPMKRSAFKRSPDSRPKRMKSAQRPVSSGEKLMWSRLASEVGCIACMKDGRFNPHVSIHHVDGRTKPGCHMVVLPLCGPHHQDDGSGAVAVHPWKAQFEAMYGRQIDLVAECMKIIGVMK